MPVRLLQLPRCPLRLFLATLFIPLLFAALACDTVSGVVGGKPSTSAPHTNGAGAFLDSCVERQDAIDDWEQKQDASR